MVVARHPDLSFAPVYDRDDFNMRPDYAAGGNELTLEELKQLRDAMEWATMQLNPFRRSHSEAVTVFAGNRYGDNHHLDKQPLNMMRLAVDIWLRQLVAKTPNCLVMTTVPDLKTDAYELEIALNHMLREINFGRNLGDCVRSAIFSTGIMKVGITGKYLPEGSGYLSEAGQPYAEPILFEDWIHDMNAKRLEDCDFMGNRYRMPWADVYHNPEFDINVRQALVPHDKAHSETMLGESYYDRTTKLSSGDGLKMNDFTPYVELWDLWLPKKKLLITIPAQATLGILKAVKWTGPKRGPFHVLGFSRIPGNVIPAGPAQTLYDMQDLFQRLFNQLGRQAMRQKTLTVVDGRAAADQTGDRAMDAPDGGVLRTNHIDGIKELEYGGVHEGNYAFVMWLREMLSYAGGNIDSMGGLSQQAETLGQERLLAQSSSQLVQDMQSKVVLFTEGVISDIARYMYEDPTVEMQLVKPIKGFGDVPFSWGPNKRKKDYFAYNFRVQPYSLQGRGPQERLNGLMTLATQFFLPLAPMLEQWGMTFNVQHFVSLIEKYGDYPEISDLIQSQSPSPMDIINASAVGKQAETGGQRTLQAPVTHRNYTRTSQSTGGTQQSRDQNRIMGLLQSGPGKGSGSGAR